MPFEGLGQDLRLAFRTLRRNRGFTAAAVLVLALGIGANSAVFSVLHAVLLAPLPYPEPDRIVRVGFEAAPRTGLAEIPLSRAGYLHILSNNRSFEAFGGYKGRSQWYVPLLGDGPPREVVLMPTQTGTFDVLGVTPALGRLPTVEEERSMPSASVVVLSHDLWASRFGSDPSILGRAITLGDRQAEVIGVMPPGFDFPSPDVDIWTLSPLVSDSEDVAEHSLLAIGRLAEGVSVEQATAEVDALIAGFGELGYTAGRLSDLFTGRASVRPLKEEVIGNARQPLLIVWATAGFVLLIACTTVANLVIVRTESRARDHAIRVALGSGRLRLARHFMMEGVVLSVLGGLLGLALAYVATRGLVRVASASIPRLGSIGLDQPVLLLTGAIAVASALLVGLLPVVLRMRPRGALGALRHGGEVGSRGSRMLDVFVVTQTAFALILLVGSGLMIRTYQQLTTVDPGFDGEGVLTFRLGQPSTETYRTSGGVQFGLLYYPLLEQLEEIPGVLSAGGVSSLPMTGVVETAGSTLGPVGIEEFPTPQGELRRNFIVVNATPAYFRTMRIPIHEGRGFTQDDYSPDYSTTAFIISASVKERYWPDESALGKILTHGRLSGPVVGVVGDVHHRGLELPPDEIIYTAQLGRHMTMVAHTTGDQSLVAAAVRSAITAIDPSIPVSEIRTVMDLQRASLSRTTFVLWLLVLSGAAALLLAAVGIYGLLSYVVSRRTAEMGVRLALGATPKSVRGLILRRSLKLAALGIALGLVGAVSLSRALSTLLFEVGTVDAGSLLAASAVLLLVAVLSGAIPARRAANISPSVALRADA